MEARPKIKLPLSKYDKIIEIIAYIALISIWMIAIYAYNTLPNILPSYFEMNGNIDAYGSNANVFVVPCLTAFLFVGFTVLNRFPDYFNYPTEITEENYIRQYTNATRLIRILKLSIVLIFLILGILPKQILWLNIIIILGIHIPMVYYIYKSFKNK